MQLHSWDVSPGEAIQLQNRLAALVIRSGTLDRVKHVAGMDISPPDAQGLVRGSVVVLTFPSLEVVEVRVAQGRPKLKYIPGLLSFRETPILVPALEQLSTTPDLILVDGQGIAHPRRFGIACHIGLLTDLPTVGCAKSILRGQHGPLASQAGATAQMVDRGEVVGAALRTRDSTSPIYVSVGHRIGLEEVVRWVLACCKGHRMPEPTRLAHEAAAGRVPVLESAPASQEGQQRLF